MIGTASLRFTMPVSLAPYPTPPVPFPTPPPPANGAQRQLVCSGCRNLLLYPVGPTSVCCAVCNAVTPVPPPGTEMAQLVCGGCHTLLMYIRGATSVQCSCCHTVNLALEGMASLAQKKIFKCFRNTIKYRLLPLLEGNKKLIFMRQRIR